MQWSWDVQPRGFLQLVPWVVGFIGRRQERDIWGSLKRLLESGIQPTSRVEVSDTPEAGGGANPGGAANPASPEARELREKASRILPLPK